MKKILLVLGALAFAAGCSSSSNSSSSGSSGTTSHTTTGTSGSGSTTGTNSSTGGTTGQTTSSSSGSTGSTGGSSGSSGSSGSVTCDGAGVANDTCLGAIALTAETPATGDTTNAKHDFTLDASGACVSNNGLYDMTGNDEVFSFTATTAARYQITVTPTTSALDAVLIVQDTCTATITTCNVAADQGLPGDPESVKVDMTSGQTVQIIVGAYACTESGSSANGPFSVLVHQLPPPPANDVCSGAVAITPNTPVSADTSNSTNDYRSPVCGGLGPDLFYGFSLASASRVTLTANASPDAGNLQPVIDLIAGACPYPDGGANELDCGGAANANESGTLDVANVPAGDYIVVVDGLNGSAGPFDLNLTLGTPVNPPTNDNCSGVPTPIVLAPTTDGGAFASATFDTFGANDDIQPSATDPNSACLDSNGIPYVSGSDVVFAVTTPATGAPSLTATVTQADGGSVYGGVIITGSPCGTSPELACGVGSSSITSPDGGALPGGTVYYIWVDRLKGLDAPAGTLQVSVP